MRSPARPSAATTLITPRAEPAPAEASRALQDRVTLAMAEFAKQGLHGLAEWWAGHPDVPRQAIVAVAGEIVWSGLRGLGQVGRPEAS